MVIARGFRKTKNENCDIASACRRCDARFNRDRMHPAGAKKGNATRTQDPLHDTACQTKVAVSEPESLPKSAR
jgi:hypothetical protein